MQKFAIAVVSVVSTAAANYLSGEVRSQEWFTYGKFVAKMQNPGKMGTVQSFFTYTAQDWPHGWNEIDVELVPSVTDNPFSMNIIWKDGAQDHNYATGFHPGTDWFTYSVEWTPDYVSWYVNDRLVRKTEGTEDVHFLNMPTQLMMNFWTPCWSPWNDYFDDAEMPWYAKYDFVEVYDYDTTKKEFKLRWRDDFNTFDQKKWYASDNWGFENNSSLFMGSQVYVEDGNLVLKMDYNDGHAREYPLHHEVVHHEKPEHENPHHVEAHHEAKAPHVDAHLAAHASPHHAVHHDAHVVSHHEAPVSHHAVVHEAAVHPLHHDAHAVVHDAHAVVHDAHAVVHDAPVHHAVTHEVAHADAHHAMTHHEAAARHVEKAHAYHEDIDGHEYQAPVVHHSYYGEVSGYPHHYSEAEYERAGHEFDRTHHGYAESRHGVTHEFKHGYSEGPHGAHTYETIQYEASGYPDHHGEPRRSEYHVYSAPAHDAHAVSAQHLGETFSDREADYLHDAYPHHGEQKYFTDVKAEQLHHYYQ